MISLKASRKLILGCPYVASTNWSIFGTRKGSLRQARLRLVKSMQTLHFPFFFFTIIVFDSHLGKNTSLIAPAYFNFSTSSFAASTCGFADLLGFCFFGDTKGSTFSLCVIKLDPPWVIRTGSMQICQVGL